MRKFLAILLSITVSGAPVISSAASTANSAVPDAAAGEKTVKEWAALLGPKSLAAAISECIDTVKTTGKTTSVTLANGLRVDTVKQADGKARAINTFDSKGALVQAIDVASAAPPERTTVANYVARDEGYQAMKKIAKDAFLTSLRNKCHGMAVKKVASAARKGAGQAEAINSGCSGSGGMDSGDDGDFYGDCSDGGGGGGGAGEDDSGDAGFYGEVIGDIIDSEFAAYGMAASGRTPPRMSCAVATSQCQQSCANLAVLMTAGCTALAASTALFSAGLLIPVAGATGVLCAGMVFDGLERCRDGCNVPALLCNP